ncbi:MAG: hypothetical protein IAE86_06940 [Burkholderiaceae bacterium]|nr:hypothetical protein [Burkholderiaceae bacterium]
MLGHWFTLLFGRDDDVEPPQPAPPVRPVVLRSLIPARIELAGAIPAGIVLASVVTGEGC